MFAYTPIEYCDLTGAGILQLTSIANNFGCAGAFKGCTNLKTLIVDNIEGDDFVGDLDKQYDVFEGCTSLKTIIMNNADIGGSSTQIDYLRAFLSRCGLDADNIDIRFKS